MRWTAMATACIVAMSLFVAAWVTVEEQVAATAQLPPTVYVGQMDAHQFYLMLAQARAMPYASMIDSQLGGYRGNLLYFRGSVVAFSREVQLPATLSSPPRSTDQTLIKVSQEPASDGSEQVIRLWYAGRNQKLRIGETVDFIGILARFPGALGATTEGQRIPTIDAGDNVRLLGQPGATRARVN